MPERESAAQGQRDPFANDVLGRLIRSNQDYQRDHGHYIVPLAERLLAARADNERLRDALDEIDAQTSGAFTGEPQTLNRLAAIRAAIDTVKDVS